jgi:DNA recombination protein RmuC
MNLIEILSLAAVLLILIAVVLLVALLRRPTAQMDLSPVQSRVEAMERGQERTARELREETARNREEFSSQARSLREEIGSTFKGFNDSVLTQLTQLLSVEQQQLDSFSEKLKALTKSNEDKIGELKTTVEVRLDRIQTDNASKLEEMRHTVDEKLQGTLERRLGESFRIVSERLEQVHKGLGEMQTLASGVGDLKRVLTNVKARGTWGEVQLGNLLEQILSPDQYAQNVATKEGSTDHVEYAIKLPGRDEDEEKVVWLPVDAKFPKEDYERLVEASEKGDPAAVDEASRSLEARIKVEAKDIKNKYIDPPHTTDFGILFLPTEGLYAEVLRRPGLAEALQRDCRVIVAGPTTFAALLNSLQMGFRTLAIQRRSSEVWTVLGAVKTEFEKFGAVIDKIHKKLQEATNEVDNAKKRSRVLERKLRDVQELPGPQAQTLLGLTEGAAAAESADETAGPEEVE